MITISKYICEFCNTEYTSDKDALTCEAQGFPEPMPFLQLGAKLPAFGENGIRYGTPDKVVIINEYNMVGSPHAWAFECSDLFASQLSHNGEHYDELRLIPAESFDPRHGWDPFRYGCTREEADEWVATMYKYGFPVMKDACHYSSLKNLLRCKECLCIGYHKMDCGSQ